MDSAKGSFLAYATSPGSVASDGDGRNGIYTKHLLASLTKSDTKLEEVFKRVRLEVAKETGNKQIPWDASSVLGDFYFRSPVQTTDTVRPSPVVAPEMSAAQREDAFWTDAKAAGNKEAFEGYLDSYPKGRYVSLARANIARLSKDVQVVSAPPVVAPVIAPPVTKPVIASPVRLPGVAFKDCDDCPEMVVIPAGSFLMGSKDDPFASSRPSSDETPQHAVSIKAFSIGKFEVTQEQWFALMGNLPSNFKGRTLPVEQVSWNDAQAFVKKLSEKTGKQYRLPSEAEWEYAARAGSQTAYTFGDDAQELGRYAWFSQNSDQTTHPVGEKQPNAFGLYDMGGNVWEWTEDCWNKHYNGAPTDGRAWTTGDCSLRVVRGGSWYFIPLGLRAASRAGDSASYRISVNGFRVAREN